MMLSEDSSRWIRAYHPAPDAATGLVCFPHAGGSAPFFLPFSRALSPSIDVLAIQYPGRQERGGEELIDHIDTLAELITRELLEFEDRPLALFGHSMGAIIAFEVAVRLEQDHHVLLEHLLVSGRRAPSVYRRESIHLRNDHDLLQEVRVLQGTHQDLLDDPDIRQMILPALRSDYHAIETYAFNEKERLTCPITAFIGLDDPRVSLEDARAWRSHTHAAFDLKTFPGGHFFLLEHADIVVEALSRCLRPTSNRRPDTG